MDHNVDILRLIGHLRDIGAAWMGGDELCRSLLASLESIVDTISRSNDVLYSMVSYIEIKWQEYANGLSYNDIKKLKITKAQIYSQFRVLETNNIPKTTRPYISIEWWIFQPIRDHWMDRSYMVFDIPPHNNKEEPFYFLHKLYAEFVMGKHVNYFDMLVVQGHW